MPTKESAERAHQWCEKNSVDFIVEGWLAAEFDAARLAEAEWWANHSRQPECGRNCIHDERIASLRQAAGEGG